MSDPRRTCAVLVPSCEAYSDLWTPFFTLFFRHWPRCPWPVFLGSDGGTFQHDRVRFLTCPPGLPWSDCVIAYLRQIEAKWVLFCLEDFFLRRDVAPGRLEQCCDQIEALDGTCLRLVRRPPPARRDVLPADASLGVLPPGAAYRVSTQAAIWRRDHLLRLLQPGESAWQFETQASLRSDALFPGGFFGVYRDVFPYRHHVVERGQWFPWEARRFGRMNIGCDFGRRAIMPPRAASLWLLGKAKDVSLAPLPESVRARLRHVFNAGKNLFYRDGRIK